MIQALISKLNYLYSKSEISPSKVNVFNAFKYCPCDNLKVVMISQDPYPQRGVATGIAFANNVSNTSPSLQLFKDIILSNIPSYKYKDFDNSLISWAQQGVLLLNSALTVEVNKIGSHSLLWKPFTTHLLKELSLKESGIVYVLFGKEAQYFKKFINQNSNYILEYKHPAFYCRMNKPFEGNPFENINEILIKNNKTKINWYEEVFF